MSHAQGSANQQRYRRLELLGQGGLCQVYRSIDELRDRVVALKQLLPAYREKEDDYARRLFEAEYHTLKQLQHPSIIEVYDYGVDEEHGPFYTMELLSGSDLQEISPLAWREACGLLMDVTSSLAVMHSRRLLHRDVTARNVRRTADGRAKLLDFGAMTEMGLARRAIGTAPYMAPEAVHQQALDGRADLYSLGALAYLVLTGRHAYPARQLQQLKQAWRSRPPAVSALVPDVPENLSALVMALLQLDALGRPQSAAEVMTRLSSIADLPLVEDAAVQHAYLTTPKLVARDAQLLRVRKQMIRSLRGRGGTLLVEAAPGMGRSRFVDACVLEAQLAGTLVVRADAADGSRAFGVARRIVDALVETRPALRKSAERLDLKSQPPGAPSPDQQAGAAPKRDVVLGQLAEFLLEASQQRAITIAIDDVHSIDEPSLALLAGIAGETGTRRLVLVLSADANFLRAPGLALRLLTEASTRIQLEALAPEQTRALLASVFGEIPNLELLTTLIHAGSAGNPREVMAAAQRLVDAKVARYEGGRWFLADEAAKIRACIEQPADVQQRLAGLSEGARRLLALLALDRDHQLELGDYAAAAAFEDAARLHEVLAELVRASLLVRGDDACHFRRLSDQNGVAQALQDGERRELHAVLAERLARKEVEPIYEAYHLVEAGRAAQAHDAMQRQMAIEVAHPGRVRNAIELDTVERMIAAGEREHWPRPLLTQYRTFCCWLAAVSGAYERVQPLAEVTLRALSDYGGLSDYHALSELPPAQRLPQALAQAQARFERTPAIEQPLAPAAALRALTRVGALTATCGYLMAEPELFGVIPSLAPLAPLSPAFGFADRLMGAFRDLAHGRIWAGWDELRAIQHDVATLSDDQLEPHNRYALELASLSGLCSFEVKYATSTALAHCDALARMQPDQAENYRMLHHLAQGRLAEAQSARKRCELLTLRAGATDDTRITRLLTYMVLFPIAGDLMGLKHTVEGLDEVVKARPGWRFRRDYTQARELRCRGRFGEALALIEGSLAAMPQAHIDWCPTAEEHVLLLTQLGRCADAARLGAEYCSRATELEMPTAWLELALALSLAELGSHAQAQSTWQEAIDALRARDIGGIHLGYAHEVGASIAARGGDEAGFEVHAQQCAQIYSPGQYPALAAKYKHLVERARSKGTATQTLGKLQLSQAPRERDEYEALYAALARYATVSERADYALSQLCQHTGAEHGALFGMREQRLQQLASTLLSDDSLELARAYLNAEIHFSVDAEKTQIDEANDVTLSQSMPKGARGPYQPVVLRVPGPGEERIVGIAMLRSNGPMRRVPAAQFVSALSEALLETGLVEAVRAAS